MAEVVKSLVFLVYKEFARKDTMKIQVAGPGCPRCIETEKNVREACAQLNLGADISHVFDMMELAKLGVIFTPAVIVDGKIMLSGKLPSVEELKKLFSEIKVKYG